MTTVVEPPKSTPSPELESERRGAMRALLGNPLVPASGETARDYMLIRRHTIWLKYWLAKFPGWELHMDKEVARLRKVPADHSDDTRPAIDATSGSSFSRRRYALLCLALAALERSERQTTLGKIAETIMEFVAVDRELQAAGLVFDIANYDQRRDLVHAVRLLLDTGLLRRIHGDERQFLNRTGTSDVLYDINRTILSVMLNVSRSPSAVSPQPRSIEESLAGLIDDPVAGNEDARSRRIRSRLVRTLLDDPMLYLSDLTKEERAYLQRQRGYLLRQIHEATGLLPEVRREGIAMVDDTGDLTDIKLPEEGTDGHLALLVAAWLAEHSADHSNDERVRAIRISEIEQHVAELIRTHGSRWRKEVREPGAAVPLTQDALLRLRGLRLIRVTAEGVVPLPAVGRYGPPRSASPPGWSFNRSIKTDDRSTFNDATH